MKRSQTVIIFVLSLVFTCFKFWLSLFGKEGEKVGANSDRTKFLFVTPSSKLLDKTGTSNHY